MEAEFMHTALLRDCECTENQVGCELQHLSTDVTSKADICHTDMQIFHYIIDEN